MRTLTSHRVHCTREDQWVSNSVDCRTNHTRVIFLNHTCVSYTCESNYASAGLAWDTALSIVASGFNVFCCFLVSHWPSNDRTRRSVRRCDLTVHVVCAACYVSCATMMPNTGRGGGGFAFATLDYRLVAPVMIGLNRVSHWHIFTIYTCIYGLFLIYFLSVFYVVPCL